jgi:hypothetical protein
MIPRMRVRGSAEDLRHHEGRLGAPEDCHARRRSAVDRTPAPSAVGSMWTGVGEVGQVRRRRRGRQRAALPVGGIGAGEDEIEGQRRRPPPAPRRSPAQDLTMASSTTWTARVAPATGHPRRPRVAPAAPSSERHLAAVRLGQLRAVSRTYRRCRWPRGRSRIHRWPSSSRSLPTMGTALTRTTMCTLTLPVGGLSRRVRGRRAR